MLKRHLGISSALILVPMLTVPFFASAHLGFGFYGSEPIRLEVWSDSVTLLQDMDDGTNGKAEVEILYSVKHQTHSFNGSVVNAFVDADVSNTESAPKTLYSHHECPAPEHVDVKFVVFEIDEDKYAAGLVHVTTFVGVYAAAHAAGAGLAGHLIAEGVAHSVLHILEKYIEENEDLGWGELKDLGPGFDYIGETRDGVHGSARVRFDVVSLPKDGSIDWLCGPDWHYEAQAFSDDDFSIALAEGRKSLQVVLKDELEEGLEPKALSADQEKSREDLKARWIATLINSADMLASLYLESKMGVANVKDAHEKLLEAKSVASTGEYIKAMDLYEESVKNAIASGASTNDDDFDHFTVSTLPSHIAVSPGKSGSFGLAVFGSRKANVIISEEALPPHTLLSISYGPDAKETKEIVLYALEVVTRKQTPPGVYPIEVIVHNDGGEIRRMLTLEVVSDPPRQSCEDLPEPQRRLPSLGC